MECPDLSTPPNHQPGTIVLATGCSGSAALRQALDQVSLESVLSGTGPIEVLTGSKAFDPLLNRAEAELMRMISHRLPTVDVLGRPIKPRHGRALGVWVDVPTPPGAIRFDAVRVPDWWRDSNRRCLVCRVTDRGETASDRPTVRLAALVHARQRLASRFSRDREALTAVLAGPWRPRLIVLVGTWRAQRIAVATFDIVTAELTWLALAECRPHPVGVGPWEHPAVQQATVLELGVAGPHQLRFVTGEDGDVVALIEYLRQRLGVDSGPTPE